MFAFTSTTTSSYKGQGDDRDSGDDGNDGSDRGDDEVASLQEGYDFIMGAIGGVPSEKSVNKLLKSIGAPDEYCAKEDTELSGEKQHSSPNNQGFEESPEIDIDFDTMPDSHRPSQRNVLSNDDLFRKDDSQMRGWGSQSQMRRGDENGSRSASGEVPAVKVPESPILLSNIVRSELAFLENAHLLNVAFGNCNDDRVCQESVSFAEWLLGAENLVGFVTQDSSVKTQTGMASTSRRLWSCLFESKVFDRLASPGSISETHVGVVAGICIRLLTCDFRPEMCSRLLKELLNVREKQKLSSIDSLYLVLSTESLERVPYRHKAIAGIWSALFEMAARKGEENFPQKLINEALQTCVDDIFQATKSTNKVRTRQVNQMISAFVDTLRLVMFMFAVKLNIFNSDDNIDKQNNLSDLVPVNWTLICRFLETFSECASSLDRGISKAMLMSFLRNVALKLCGSVWPMNEALMHAVGKGIFAVCEVESRSCFCETAPVHTAQFCELNPDDSASRKLEDLLRTPCDYSFYFGWLFVTHGSGNAMKRVMNIIRNSSQFTNANGKGSDSSVRALHHHIGLVVSVADSIAESSSSEEHVCQMLTSKCTDLIGMLKSKDVSGGDNDRKWDSVFRAIVARCRLVAQHGGSVHVYVKWLWMRVSESLTLLKKVAERRSAGARERELLRVQDSFVHASALKRLKTVAEVMDVVESNGKDRDCDRSVMYKVVEVAAEHVVKLITFCRESVERMRLKYAQGAVRNRDSLVTEALAVLKLFFELLVRVCTDTPSSDTGLIGRFARRQGLYSSLVNGSTEAVFIDLMGKEELIQDAGMAKQTSANAALLLSMLIELRVMARDDGWTNSGCAALVELLGKSNVDILRRHRNQGSSSAGGIGAAGSGSGMDLKEVDDTVILNFWWKAMRSKWVCEVIERCPENRAIVLGFLGWVLVGETEYNEEDVRLVEEMRLEARYMDQVRHVLKEWVDGEGTDSNTGVNGRKSECVKRILSYMETEIGRQKTRALVAQLRNKAMGMLRSKRKEAVLDGLMIVGMLFQVESHGRGFCSEASARWMQQWIGDIVSSLQRIRHANGGVYAWRRGSEWYEACDQLQMYVMCGVCMTSSDGRDVAMRVCVLRFFNAMDECDDLQGVWAATVGPLVFSSDTSGQVNKEMERKARRNLTEWRKYAFRSIVEDALLRCLTSGKIVITILKRLAAATKASTKAVRGSTLGSATASSPQNVESHRALLALIKALVARIHAGRLFQPILRDVAARMLWTQVCAALDVEFPSISNPQLDGP